MGGTVGFFKVFILCLLIRLAAWVNHLVLQQGDPSWHKAPASQSQTDATTTQNETHFFSCNIIWQTRVKWVEPTHFFHRMQESIRKLKEEREEAEIYRLHTDEDSGWPLPGTSRYLATLQVAMTPPFWIRTVVMKEPWRLIFVRTGDRMGGKRGLNRIIKSCSVPFWVVKMAKISDKGIIQIEYVEIQSMIIVKGPDFGQKISCRACKNRRRHWSPSPPARPKKVWLCYGSECSNWKLCGLIIDWSLTWKVATCWVKLVGEQAHLVVRRRFFSVFGWKDSKATKSGPEVLVEKCLLQKAGPATCQMSKASENDPDPSYRIRKFNHFHYQAKFS